MHGLILIDIIKGIVHVVKVDEYDDSVSIH